jgi:predicted NAD-dependent protein-ADP-ribosyltransferase YbiA (DUF1768 family)
LVLAAAYDATLLAGEALSKRRGGERVKVYLTKLGDGAFGNETSWVAEAVQKALDDHKDAPLDVYLVHYGSNERTVQANELLTVSSNLSEWTKVDLQRTKEDAKSDVPEKCAVQTDRFPSQPSGSDAWPSTVLRKALAASPVSAGAARKRCVLLTTGAMNPVHHGHLAMFTHAKKVLERDHGFTVLGGFLSPSHDLYVGPKCRAKGQTHALIHERVNMCRIAVQNHPWIEVGLWESSRVGYWPDYPEVVVALADHVHSLDGGSAGADVAVLYLCGTDHARFSGKGFGHPREGVVVVPRAEESPHSTDVGRLVYGISSSGCEGSLSSTEARGACARGDAKQIEGMLGENVGRYVMERRMYGYDDGDKKIALLPPGFLHKLPVTAAELTEPYYYLSARQADTCRGNTLLAPFADHLPGYVPHRIIADAMGFGHGGIHNAVASLQGSSYVWATEFENVHAVWDFKEPRLTIDGRSFRGSEHYYQSQKPTPFNEVAWDSMKMGVMRTSVRAKFAASAEARKLLLATHPHTLLSIKNDRCWGFHPVHGGENRLATILMELRDEVKAAMLADAALDMIAPEGTSRNAITAEVLTCDRPSDAPPLPPREWNVPVEVTHGKTRNTLMASLRVHADPEQRVDAIAPTEEAAAIAVVSHDDELAMATFMGGNGEVLQPRLKLADLILGKIQEQNKDENGANRRGGSGGGGGGSSTHTAASEALGEVGLSPKIIEVYQGVGKHMQRYPCPSFRLLQFPSIPWVPSSSFHSLDVFDFPLYPFSPSLFS